MSKDPVVDAPVDTVYDRMIARGVKRRDVLKFCAWMGACIGLAEDGIAKVVEALHDTITTYKGQYLLLCEGSIPTAEDGVYCCIGEQPGEAWMSYWFGMTRFIHFATAYVFFWNFVVRIHWGFVGNQYADWKNFLPHRMSQLREVLLVGAPALRRGFCAPPLALRHDVGLILFTFMHVYLVFYHDYVEGHGVMSSMVGGWKFIHRKQAPKSEEKP